MIGDMFYLIGGAPRLGKTIVTRALAKHLSIPWISTDQIRAIMRSVGDREKYPALRVMEDESNMNEKFIETPTEVSVRLSNEESDVVWKGVVAFMKSHDDPTESYVIEGIGVVPSKLKTLKGIKYKVLYLHQQDKATVQKKVKASSDPHDWFMSNISEEAFDHGIQFFTALNEHYYKEAQKYGFDVFEMTEDIQSDIEKVKEYFA